MTTTTTTPLSVNLDGEDYENRLYGCWKGKNAGGTLGTPIETAWGQEEPFDIWWYPELQEGGLPNDDLEMQLVWLKALEEVGPGITARDLSRYWLDHIGYNFDEYGLSKLNLRWGLEPPLSGHHNNWFIDCMGSPIRSEIWACVAPGQPRIAAHYAFQDAICDHAGGEGVFGELFNAALESAAFVVQEPKLLIDIALSYVPHDSMVRKAVLAAVAAFDAGVDWKTARRAVLDATPHYNAQYSPINTGFQVIGLLYGRDFGEALCITVNCGYDTDSSGAAIGSYLGIILGNDELPLKWVEPLGMSIATNQSWGGVKSLDAEPNPVPADLTDLIGRIKAAARKVLAHHGKLEADQTSVNIDDLYADDSIRALFGSSPTVVPFPDSDYLLEVDYLGGPVAYPARQRTVATSYTNTRVEPIDITVRFEVPEGWRVEPAAQTLRLNPAETARAEWFLTPPEEGRISTRNVSWVHTQVTGRPVPRSAPVVLLGAYALRTSELYPAQETLAETLDFRYPPEVVDQDVAWSTRFAAGHEQPVADLFDDGAGVVYLQTYVYSPTQREVWVAMDPSCPIRYWVNGEAIGGNDEYRRVRPSQNSADGIGHYARLEAGWNEVLIKLVFDDAHPAPQLFLGFTSHWRIHEHQWDLTRTCFPWSPGFEPQRAFTTE